MELEFKIIDRSGYLFVSLKGKINKDSKDVFDQCLHDLQVFESKTVVLLLNDVSTIEQSMSRNFTLLQHEIRSKNKNMFLIGLKSQLKEELNYRGLLRSHELKSNIEEVLRIVNI